MKMPLKPAELAALLTGLSDQESGGARQWFWLELANAQPPAQATPRVRRLLLVLRLLGPSRLLPLLQQLGTPCLALYQAGYQSRIERWKSVLTDTLLGIGCVLAIAAGFGWQPASVQFALWLVCIGALLLAAWRSWRAPHAAAEFPAEEALPGAEASLGLTGMLLARGCAPSSAPRLVALLRSQPEQALPLLVAALPELVAPPMHGRWLRWRTMLVTWPGITLITSKINGYTHIPVNYLLSALVLVALLSLLRPARGPLLLVLGSWAGAGALAALARWI
ncbi:hypothetical protein [Chitinilyticum piscinae]|uniref:Uncharacterized protein n=1 Tax=Chitinilyticum piscinae TaxID=2866724 RepID=A0A8J7KC61_9NEIS|nr:hypothetical protein [Chitinilyticum piscinae]MBE9611014.1 hypothetical protein [Chitinilyticum piscinae]